MLKFRNFLKKIIVHVKKERETWSEGIDQEPSRNQLLDVGQPIIQRKRQFLDSCGSCFTPMIATNAYAYGSPIFKAVQQKWYKALCRALTKSPKSPEYAVGEGSEPSHIDRSAGVP